jgi:hypothetical protein
VLKGNYTTVIYSLLVHGLLFFIIFIAQPKKQHSVQSLAKVVPIKSFIYYAPKLAEPVATVTDEPRVETTPPAIIETKKSPEKKHQEQPKEQQNLFDKDAEKATKLATDSSKLNHSTETVITTLPAEKKPAFSSQPPPLPKPMKRKLDSFTQLQNLRSKLNQRAINNADNPYRNYQAPSAFNTENKSVPHSVPLKDEEKERKKRTKNMGAGIAITKGEDGRCSITQDLSVYGLSEGSSTQFFACGESKFDQSFRAHMKKVKAKIGKN